jgi:23S rRNA (cytidine1920-2'-O)/16S rRNA (cytidine1409-2'-O)-methyltransferase
MPNNMPKKNRLDEALIAKGLTDTVEKARALIMAGSVIVNDQRVDKPGLLIKQQDVIRIKDVRQFVSRGGDKLFGALKDFNLTQTLKDRVVLDVGASTGGFTDCCLQCGAALVLAVDIGTNQLDWSLRNNPKVQSFERTDIRQFQPPHGITIDWVVADVSFNHIGNFIASIAALAPRSSLLLLVKPQFELPTELIPKGGVVSDNEIRQSALSAAVETVENHGFAVKKTAPSQVLGRSGNLEYFIFALAKPSI